MSKRLVLNLFRVLAVEVMVIESRARWRALHETVVEQGHGSLLIREDAAMLCVVLNQAQKPLPNVMISDVVLLRGERTSNSEHTLGRRSQCDNTNRGRVCETDAGVFVFLWITTLAWSRSCLV